MENKKQIKLYLGDNIESLKKLPDNSIDSVVTDAPYGLGKEQDMNIVLKDWIEKGYSEIKGKGFMGKEWDAYVPQPAFWKELYRVLKPGGHILCFFGTRTYDIGTMAIRLAGFEIRDQIQWIYSTGFPKSLNIGKAFDKKNGNEREPYERPDFVAKSNKVEQRDSQCISGEKGKYTKGSSQYEGWGTALKPANEPICLARKPLSEKTIVDNVIKWGTGGINVDGCRIGNEIITGSYAGNKDSGFTVDDNRDDKGKGMFAGNVDAPEYSYEGRFPANILFDEEAAQILDKQSGPTSQGHWPKGSTKGFGEFGGGETSYEGVGPKDKNKDKLGASRFFYVAKVSKKERNLGLDNFEEVSDNAKGNGLNRICDKCSAPQLKPCDCKDNSWVTPAMKNNHPTLKPINLMTYLCRLITPPGGIVLDPFMGSGSTGISACLEGFRFVGMELDEDYFKIAEARVNNFEEYRKLLK